MTLKNYTMGQIFSLLIGPAVLETLQMMLFSGILSVVFGFVVGVVLVVTEKNGLWPNPVLHRVLDIIVNIR